MQQTGQQHTACGFCNGPPDPYCCAEGFRAAAFILSLTGRFARDGEPEPEGEPKEDDEETYSETNVIADAACSPSPHVVRRSLPGRLPLVLGSRATSCTLRCVLCNVPFGESQRKALDRDKKIEHLLSIPLSKECRWHEPDIRCEGRLQCCCRMRRISTTSTN